jgi:cell division FtsZ-interacting protein ZapD
VALNVGHEDQEGRPKFIFGNNGHRLVKKIIQALNFATESSKLAIEEGVEKLVAAIHGHLQLFLETKGVFVVVAILEHSEYRESLSQFLQKHRQTIQRLTINPGVAVLAKILAK